MASRRGLLKGSLVKAVQQAKQEKPPHTAFMLDLMHGIEEHSAATRRAGSNYYKPSSMTCQRQMFYTRSGAEKDLKRQGYQGVGMADTGTRRHEAIQEVLEVIDKYGFPWKYWDVEEFLKLHRWPKGLCKNLKVVGKQGGETALRDDVLFVSFRCDGIIEHLEDTTGDPFYLFEFKNQISYSAQNKNGMIDEKHHAQVNTYGMEFELNKAFVTYENRDNCALEVPETFAITQQAKDGIIDLLLETESYVERGIAPPSSKNKSAKFCQYCDYATQCMLDR